MIHEWAVGIHFVALLFCFYAVYLIAKRENKERANYMVVTIICNIITLVGYILEITATDVSAMLVAVKMQYLGKGFVGTFLLFTFVRYYKWKFPNILMYIFWTIDTVMYLFIFALEKHMMYYTSIDTMTIDGREFLLVEKSIIYILFMFYMVGTLLLYSFLCYKHWRVALGREKKMLGKLAMVSLGADVAIVLSVFDFAYPYDLVPVILTVFTVVIAIFIHKYGLFQTLDIAKDNLIVNIDEGVIVRDVDGSFQYANPKAYKMIPQLEIEDKRFVDVVINDVLRGRTSDTVMFENQYYQVKVRQLFDDKEVAGEIITFFDITELQENSKRMEQLKIEADNANHAKSSFLANMSHEIRTPINAVLGMDEMILRECEDENVREYAMSIKRAGENLLALVSDILDFSKIESGKMTIIRVEYRVKDVIADVVNTFSLRMRQKGLSFVTEIDKNIPSILVGDEVRIKQIIMNILSNAFKYTKEGYVKFKIGGEQKEDKFMLKISIEDTGIGIKEDDIDKLFETFERIEEKKNRHIEGSGLGLNITRNILKMMGSDIQVKSVYGMGSIFSFVLEQEISDVTPIGDISLNMAKEDKTKHSDIEFEIPEARILVVDDNAVNLTVMKGLLKKTKAIVDTALSGAECIRLVKQNKYHIIFMDHLMPELDGIETLHKMNEMSEHFNKETPVIALTANAISGAREMYMEEGFDDYMTKPIDVDTIDKNLLKYIPKDLIVHKN